MANNIDIDYERIYENFSIRDEDNPYSLIYLVPEFIKQAILSIPEEFLSLSEKELEAMCCPDSTLKKLRTAFSLEYVRSIRTATKMIAPNIHEGICYRNHFNKIVSTNTKLVYLITPRPDYNVELEDLLHVATDEMRRILEFPLVDDRGRLNEKILAAKIKLFNDLSNRRRGQLAQKLDINSKSLNVNVDALPRSVSDIQAQLQELDQLEKPAIEAPIEKEAKQIKEEEDPGTVS